MPAWIGTALLKYLVQPLLTYLVLPLIQGLISSAVWAVKTWQRVRRAEQIIEEDKKKYDEAKTPEEQENAFEDSLHNSAPGTRK